MSYSNNDPSCCAVTNEINDLHNRDTALKYMQNAVDEANKWTAYVPFILSKFPHDHDQTIVDIFSMVIMKPYEKISKYEAHVTEKFKAHIDMTLNDLLGVVVNDATT